MHADWNINVVRPTVTFGERNRAMCITCSIRYKAVTF